MPSNGRSSGSPPDYRRKFIRIGRTIVYTIAYPIKKSVHTDLSLKHRTSDAEGKTQGDCPDAYPEKESASIGFRLKRGIKIPSIYRGWWVVSVPFLAAAIGTGAGQYGFGIFIEPLEQEFGWTRSQISASLSFTAVGSLIAPVLGRIMDKYGTKHVITISLALTAVGYLLRPFMTELWHWYALSLLQYSGYTGASMLPAGKLVGLWFHRTRGRVMGITAMGNNFGGLVVPPILGGILILASWKEAYVALGVMSVLMVFYTLAAVRDFPSASELGDQLDSAPGDRSVSQIIGGVSVQDALRSKAFYAITLVHRHGHFHLLRDTAADNHPPG